MKILCIDGGGIFGIVPAFFLSRSTGWLDKFQTLGGTSAGSQLVLSYATKRDPLFTYNSWYENTAKVFERAWYEKLNPVGPKYKDTNLNANLQTIISGRFGDIQKHMFIPTYDLENERPKIFDNIIQDEDCDWNNWEIARASSAAPTYFAPYKGYIDGGIIADNASMITAWGVRDKLNIPFEEMELLVLGTGYKLPQRYTQQQMAKWNAINWLTPMINMLTCGNIQTFAFGCEQMGFKKYIRFDPIVLDADWDMDDVTLLDSAIQRCLPHIPVFQTILDNF